MNRPYIVTLVSSSLDGKIALAANRTMFEEMDDQRTDKSTIWTEVENELKTIHNPQVDLL